MNDFILDIKERGIGKVLENISLSNYTTYKVGGTCRVMVSPKDEKSLVTLMKLVRDYGLKYKILGFGSNVLFSDKLYDGVIIRLDFLDSLEQNGTDIIVGAGYSLMRLSNYAVKKGLAGLEFANGIPGTVGGAVYMNAGAYKSDMGYIVKKVRVLTPDFKVINMANREMNFKYRNSFLQTHSGYICLEATISLVVGNREALQEVVRDRKERRLNDQPLEYPSAGSVFRNPEGDYAGKLIEDLGFKGLIKGGAQVSSKHANFVVNIGNATASDIKELIDYIKESVKVKYNIDLKVEQEFVNWE